ncbi:hypothetical protein Nepgr_014697 [Nepenthes gracilis]|uniref:Uncharacterized protein n=1 Tax=Nepenthes gracilis TaxID=150966 RepID=A0AAD3XQK5_NEPGR|nr:hypothetical protein Nepgr_014697 [Nepenthes gracilis]
MIPASLTGRQPKLTSGCTSLSRAPQKHKESQPHQHQICGTKGKRNAMQHRIHLVEHRVTADISFQYGKMTFYPAAHQTNCIKQGRVMSTGQIKHQQKEHQPRETAPDLHQIVRMRFAAFLFRGLVFIAGFGCCLFAIAFLRLYLLRLLGALAPAAVLVASAGVIMCISVGCYSTLKDSVQPYFFWCCSVSLAVYPIVMV